MVVSVLPAAFAGVWDQRSARWSCRCATKESGAARLHMQRVSLGIDAEEVKGEDEERSAWRGGK